MSSIGRPTGDSTQVRRGGFSPLRDLPSTFWLLAAGLSLVFQRWITAPQWLVIHLVVLGAASHSILVWSRHFTHTLLKAAPSPSEARQQSVRLAVLNIGTLAVVAGVLGSWRVLVMVGATAVMVAVGWHASALFRQLRAALSVRLRSVVRYYIAAACLLPIGVLLGTLLATGTDLDMPARLLVAHVVTNGFGWLGITVAGTVVTLWPTVLQAPLADGAERAAARALPWLVGGIIATDAAALLGMRIATSVTLLAFLIGIGILAVPFAMAWRLKPARDMAALSLLGGVSWFVFLVVYLDLAIATTTDWNAIAERLTDVTPAVAAGFAAQMLIGAMSYLLPVALAAGVPDLARRAHAFMNRGAAFRLVLVNGGVAIALLPGSDLLHAIGWGLVAIGILTFLVLMRLVGPDVRKARLSLAGAAASADAERAAPGPVTGEHRRAQAVVGIAVIAIAVAVGVAFAPASDSSLRVKPTGATTTVSVVAQGMRFYPSSVEVPAGNRLVVTVRNADPTATHDLAFAGGISSGMLAPGASARVDAGIVAGSTEGWCSVPGHRQMGMVLRVVATGTVAPNPADGGIDMAAHTADSVPSAASLIDLSKAPADSFAPYPAELPALPSGTVHRITLQVEHVVREVAPGVRQRLWTYNGSAPGPVLHGRVGDEFDVTVVNRSNMDHSIDFHAGEVSPDGVMGTIPPGGTLRYRFRATHAGIWLYHCSTMPMSVHIANGMFGAVVIDPPDLSPVAREYVLVQSELYLGAQGGEADVDKVLGERRDLMAFNGYANQYVARPLAAKVGERVRIWVLDAGPSRPSSFHVVGGQFDTVFHEGAYVLRPGAGASQSLGLQASQGGFVEMVLREPGRYTFVSHIMVDAERGARGTLVVTD